MLSQILKQPFPFESSLLSKAGKAGATGIFIFLALILIKPFPGSYHTGELILISFIYAVIAFLTIFICSAGLPVVFPSVFYEPVWNTQKQVIFSIMVLLLTGLAFYLLSPSLVNTEADWPTFLKIVGLTLALGIVPSFIFIITKSKNLNNRFSNQAGIIKQKLQEKFEQESELNKYILEYKPERVTLSGENQHDQIELHANDLLLISSVNNYIKIFHHGNGKPVYSILRSTLKKAEDSLQQHPNFFKCHPLYIINLDKVVHIEGNAQGYKLKIHGYQEFIPVSRELNGEFSDKLLAFRKKLP